MLHAVCNEAVTYMYMNKFVSLCVDAENDVGRRELAGGGAPAPGERAAGPRERALRSALRVVHPALQLHDRLRRPHALRHQLRDPGAVQPAVLGPQQHQRGAVAQGRAVVRGGPGPRRGGGLRRDLLPHVPRALCRPHGLPHGRALPPDAAQRAAVAAQRQPHAHVRGLEAPKQRAVPPAQVRRGGGDGGAGQGDQGGAGRNCSGFNDGANGICHLFARKFAPDTVEPLLRLAPKVRMIGPRLKLY
jgi:hypothetical protein